MRDESQTAAALEMIKAVYDDGKAEINGIEYTFTKMTHKNRRSVCAYYTTVAPALQSGQFGFMDTPEFERIEKIISDHILVDGSQLTKVAETHWSDHPENYLMFISSAMGAMSYPFLAGSRTG